MNLKLQMYTGADEVPLYQAAINNIASQFNIFSSYFLKATQCDHFVTFHDKEPVGIISWYYHPLKKETVAQVQAFYVLPEYRTHRIGTDLVLQLMKFLKNKEIDNVIFTSSKNSIESLKFHHYFQNTYSNIDANCEISYISHKYEVK